MIRMTGGCLCGKLCYAADTEPIFSAVCHCKTCQKQTGTAFQIVVAVPRPAVCLQGVQRTYSRMGDSGQEVINRFCPDCGSTVMIEPAALGAITIIPAGTLDETSGFNPRWKSIATMPSHGSSSAAECSVSQKWHHGKG
jgi:hypothetical protein